MIKLGAHAFVWIGEWNTESGNYAIEQCGALGFDNLEIPLLRPDDFDVKSHRAALDKAGIEATCSLALPRSMHMPHHPVEAKAFLIRALDKVQALDCHFLGGCIAYSLGMLTGEPPTAAERQTIVEVLGELCEEARKRDITLALEACNRYETYLFNTLADTRDTILRVGKDNLKLHADTYHMNIEEERFDQAFIDAADVVNYVHMSESHRGRVGTGTVKWDEVWRGLAQMKFSGYLVLESFAAINPDLAAATCLWRPPKDSADVLAQEGIAFLKEGIKTYLS